jgi:hypothetical protein
MGNLVNLRVTNIFLEPKVMPFSSLRAFLNDASSLSSTSANLKDIKDRKKETDLPNSKLYRLHLEIKWTRSQYSLQFFDFDL